jgi:hypothetical protein
MSVAASYFVPSTVGLAIAVTTTLVPLKADGGQHAIANQTGAKSGCEPLGLD